MPTAGLIARALVVLCSALMAGCTCDYGTLPGYWNGFEYILVDPACQLRDRLGEWSSPASSGEVDGILMVGDSFDRQAVQATAALSGQRVKDYTPVPRKNSTTPRQVGRNMQVMAGKQYLRNLFIYGASNRGHYPDVATIGAVEGMSNLTHSRICSDYQRYAANRMPAGLAQAKTLVKTADGAPSTFMKDPYMIVVSSVLWDVMQWYLMNGSRGWTKKDYNVPKDISEEQRAKKIYQVFESGPKGDEWKQALAQYQQDVAALIGKVKDCFPGTQLFCWRTAPLPSTDSRNRNFWLKPPYAVAAFNAVGRHVAESMGLCILDMAQMMQGRGNDGFWVPDGSHPADEALGQYVNVLLNVLMQHKESRGQKPARPKTRNVSLKARLVRHG